MRHRRSRSSWRPAGAWVSAVCLWSHVSLCVPSSNPAPRTHRVRPAFVLPRPFTTTAGSERADGAFFLKKPPGALASSLSSSSSTPFGSRRRSRDAARLRVGLVDDGNSDDASKNAARPERTSDELLQEFPEGINPFPTKDKPPPVLAEEDEEDEFSEFSEFSEYDEYESYESKWRKRRLEALKRAPELSATELVDLFEADYLQRRLYEQAPNQAFGAVFKLEGVLADVDPVPALAKAWRRVAEEFEVEKPSDALVESAMYQQLRDELTIERVFQWTTDWGLARDMARRYTEIVTAEIEDLPVAERDGAYEWVESLSAEGIPCAVLTKLPAKALRQCLDKLDLARFFDDRVVTADDERDRPDQALLHAALTLERQPSRCVVFSDAVADLVGAHDAEMRCVGVLSERHPAYELRVADLVVVNFDELRLSNIRRLFADRDFDEMSGLQLQPELEPVRRRLKTKVATRIDGRKNVGDLSEYENWKDDEDPVEEDYYDDSPPNGRYGDYFDDNRDRPW